MKKVIWMFLLGSLALAMSSCEMETTDNGDLDGFWHLESVDTLATGGVRDYSDQHIFWAVQYKLISISDQETFKDFRGFWTRFNQTGDSLILTSLYRNHWHQNQGTDGGDIPITEMNDTLRRCGINQLVERYRKEKLSGSKMVLTTKELRLKFTKF